MVEVEKIPIRQTKTEYRAENNIPQILKEDSIWMEFGWKSRNTWIWNCHKIVSDSSISTIPEHILTIRQYLEEKQFKRQENPTSWW